MTPQSSPEIASGPSLPELVRRWQAGWGRAKGLGPALDVGGGLRVPIGRPNRHAETVVVDADGDPATLARLADEVVASEYLDWLTVPTRRPDDVAAELGRAGLELLDRPEWMMAVALGGQAVAEVPSGYAIRVAVEDAAELAVDGAFGSASGDCVIEVTLRDEASGDLAARGLMAVVGVDAIAHNIETEPEYRRRGLARVVMHALATEARSRGGSTGLLIASEDGFGLYSALGWTEVARVLIARRDER